MSDQDDATESADGFLAEEAAYVDAGSLASGCLTSSNVDNQNIGSHSVLEWALSGPTQAAERTYGYGKATKVFPALRHPEAHQHESNVNDITRSYADVYRASEFFADTYFDAHVNNETLARVLVEDQIQSRARRQREHTDLMVSVNMQMPFTSNGRRPKAFFPAVVFVAGVNDCDINIVQLHHDTDLQIVGAFAGHKSLYTCETPILQLQACGYPEGAIVAARSASTVLLLQLSILLQSKEGNFAKHSIIATCIFMSHPDLFGGQHPVDVCLCQYESSLGRALIVDDAGSVWQTDGPRELIRLSQKYDERRPILVGVRCERLGDPYDGRSSFAKVTYGTHAYSAVIARQDGVRVHDFRDPFADAMLFQLKPDDGEILDMVGPAGTAVTSKLRFVLTLELVLVLDLHQPGKAVLAYKHRMNPPHMLRLSVLPAAAAGLHAIAVCDSTTGSLLVLQVEETGGHCHFRSVPTVLQAECSPLRGHCWAQLTHAPKDTIINPALFTLDTAGAIWCCEAAGVTHVTSSSRIQRAASPGLLLAEAATGPPSIAQMDRRNCVTIDLRKTYEAIFATTGRLFSTDDTAEKRHTSANGLFWLPLECVDTDATLSDASSATDPTMTLRRFCDTDAIDAADLAEGPLDAIVAAMNDRSEQASFDLPQHFYGDLSNSAETFADELHKTYYDALVASAETPAALQRAFEHATRQISLDLALSRNIYADQDVPNIMRNDEPPPSMTTVEALEDLPDLDFGFFRPVRKSSGPESSTTPAARALLSEWQLGADPSHGAPYVDPYSKQLEQTREANAQYTAFRKRIHEGADISASQPVHAQRGPTPRAIKPVAPPQPQIPARSQQILMPSSQILTAAPAPGRAPVSSQTFGAPLASFTQPVMPATQIATGPHGGRPTKKKRVGGF